MATTVSAALSSAAVFAEAKQAATDAVAAYFAKMGAEHDEEVGFNVGWAWVTVRPARGPFVSYLKAQIKVLVGTKTQPHAIGSTARQAQYEARTLYGDNGIHGGWEISNPGNYDGQSFVPKFEGAKAFAAVLAKHGIDCSPSMRLD